MIKIASNCFSGVIDTVHLILNTAIGFAVDQLQKMKKCSGHLKRTSLNQKTRKIMFLVNKPTCCLFGALEAIHAADVS